MGPFPRAIDRLAVLFYASIRLNRKLVVFSIRPPPLLLSFRGFSATDRTCEEKARVRHVEPPGTTHYVSTSFSSSKLLGGVSFQ
jgi:hypothetical protein